MQCYAYFNLREDKIMKSWFKSFVHNCIVHPLMQFLPQKIGTKLHDSNAEWAFSLNRYDELKLERQKDA